MIRLNAILAAAGALALSTVAIAEEAAQHAGAAVEHITEHAGAEHAQPPLLSADPGAAIWTLILFCLLLVILGKFVWPTILSGLQAREGKIRGDIQSAEAANAKAQQTLAEYQKQLAEA